LHLELKTNKADPQVIQEFSELGMEVERLHKERNKLLREAKRRWTNIIEAKEVLLDEVKRKMYDMEAFPSKQSEFKAREELHRMKVRQANLEVENMREEVSKIMKSESEEGLVILEARYGDVSHTMMERPGCYIDVRIPIQAMVGQLEKSVLDYVPPSSRTSYAFLKGFYNPLWIEEAKHEEDRFLEIIYKYKGRLHIAEFYDGDPFVLPRKEHICEKHETMDDVGWRAQETKRERRERTLWGICTLAGSVAVVGATILIFGWGSSKKSSNSSIRRKNLIRQPAVYLTR